MVGTHRRGGQAGPPDGLGAGVQGRVFGLMQDRVHAEGLLAVHRHHDCGREGGSLCVVLVRLRFGSVRTETPRGAEVSVALPRWEKRWRVVKKRKEEEK